MNIDREFLERVLAAMEGVIDVADRKTDEFDALRSCVVDLTVVLFKRPTTEVALKQGDQEAVAWRWSESNGERWFDWTADWSKHGKAQELGCLIQYAYTRLAPVNQQLLEALKQLVIATKHLNPCPGTLEMAEKAIAAVEKEMKA